MKRLTYRQVLILSAWMCAGLLSAELGLVELRGGLSAQWPSAARLWVDAGLMLVASALSLLTLMRVERRPAGRPGLLGSALVGTGAFFIFLLMLGGARSAIEWTLLPGGPGGFFCSSGSAEAGGDSWREWGTSLLETTLLLDAACLPLLLIGIAAARQQFRLRRPAFGAVLLGAYYLTCGDQRLWGEPPPEAPPTLVTNPLVTGCSPGAFVRSYEVSAIHVTLPLNRFGEHVRDSFMYVLDQSIPAVRAQEARLLPARVTTGLRKDPIQPLVLRANLGDCLVLRFTNRLQGQRASMHVHGLPHNVAFGAGAVGQNPDTFANPGQQITYILPIPTDEAAERAYFIHSHGASRGLHSHGLFGTLVVEPAGAVYRDVETGAPLSGSSWEAIIDLPAGQLDFREFVLMYHEIGDEQFEDVLRADGSRVPQVDPLSGAYRPSTRAINYRSEPFLSRLELNNDESQAYGSYAFGDPATPIPRSYLGEPTKTRLVHGGSETFHVHHLHGGATRWKRNPKIDISDFGSGLQKIPVQDALSLRLDSQSLGPATTYNNEHECGAGGCQQAAGDFLFHCHIQHHYLAGMWSFWRVFDTLQEDLAVLPDRAPPPEAVDSRGLVGKVVEGKMLVPRAVFSSSKTQTPLEDFIEAQLPPPGEPFDSDDATVWDWRKVSTSKGPLYLGEPETKRVWANYQSPTPGQRAPILFNPTNGRYAWPLLRPHLGQRPPFAGNGHTGAPWLGEVGSKTRPDGLCPDLSVVPDRRRARRTYPISAIATPVQVGRSRVDEDGMLFVLNEDKQAILDGLRPKEPLVIRANTLDCVDIVFTNDISDEDTLLEDGKSKANLHTHFVQFDPQASDGVITGFAFEQSVKPYRAEGRRLELHAKAGTRDLRLTRVTGLRPGVWLGVGLGEGMCTPPGGGAPRACTEVRRIAAMYKNWVRLEEPLELDHPAGQWAGVEFVRHHWYADVDDGTVFWHDHITPGGWMHGLFGALIIEPVGASYHDPRTGQEVRSGAIVDVRAPPSASVGVGQRGSFREVFLGLSDEGGGGRAEETVAKGTLNLRAEPFEDRDRSPGLIFSSVRNGDPVTPLPRAYVGDPVVFRTLNAGTIGTGLKMTGHRFALERFLPDAPLVDTAPLGVSERFDLILQGGAGGMARQAGDYLFHATIGEQFEGGAWGILRVHDTAQPDLRPLPGHPPPPSGTGFPLQRFTGGLPEPAGDSGNPCPASAPVRRYDTQLQYARIVYGPDSEDSGGIVYTLRAQAQPPLEVTEPLVLRVNAGECLEVLLTNRTQERAGLTAAKLRFDPQGSYGAAVGFNMDSTVAPGETRLYRFFADDPELGTNVFVNLGRPRTGARGAFGAIIVEPPGAVYKQPLGGGTLLSGVAATIEAPSGSFRELVVLLNDEDPRIGENTMPYHSEVDGFSGLSYSALPLERRDFLLNPSAVFSDAPFSPLLSNAGQARLVLRAATGDAVTLRVAQAYGEQLHSFGVGGHRWRLAPRSPRSERVSSQVLSPGYSFEAELLGGAGGGVGAHGDYFFSDQRKPFEEAGLWGFLRVRGVGNGLLPLPPPTLPVHQDAGAAPSPTPTDEDHGPYDFRLERQRPLLPLEGPIRPWWR